MVLLAIAVADAFNYANGDMWLHIVIGRIILTTHRVPVVDAFSYTVAGHHVRNHEWLTEVALALVWREFGSLGLRLFKLACVTGTIVALALAISSTGAEERVQRTVLLLTAAALAPFMYLFRPDLLTVMLLSVEIAMLAFETYRGGATLWPLIPVFALWANLHGGFIAGLGALGVYALATLVRDIARRAGIRQAARLLVLTSACALATLANPFGVGAWRTVLLSVSNSAIRSAIPGWVPIWSRIAYGWSINPIDPLIFVVPLALVAATIFFLLKTPTDDDLPLVAIAAVFTVAAFEITRNLPLAMVMLAAPLARHAALTSHRKREKREPRAAENPDKGLNRVVLAGLALALVLIGREVSPGPLRVVPPSPAGAVDFMNKHHLHGNILNPYPWGNYLIWHTYPQSHVFIDARLQQAYPQKFIRQDFAFEWGEPRGKAVLNDYPNDLVLVSPKSGAFRLVSADPRWKLIYRDGVAALFVKSSSKAAQEFPHPVIGKSPPSLFP